MSELKSIDETLSFIRDSAPKIAKAKSERIYLENYKKSLFAILYSQAPPGTVADRENYAYSDPKYIDHLEALKIAVFEEEKIRWLLTASELRVEVWRSEQANNRFIDRVHT